MSARLRVHDFIASSTSNGPGKRAVLWLQGCSLRCPGCFNPQTHPSTGGAWRSINELMQMITALGTEIEGLTISGGEPLDQAEGLAALLHRIRSETRYSIVLFSGYPWEMIAQTPAWFECARMADIVLAGPYIQNQHLAAGLRGSANKTCRFITNRYTQSDLDRLPEAEVWIDLNGVVTLSGIRPVKAEIYGPTR